MKKPKRAGDSPIAVNLEQGKRYAWCTCGLSGSQPFCDGKHKGGEFSPQVFVAEKNETGGSSKPADVKSDTNSDSKTTTKPESGTGTKSETKAASKTEPKPAKSDTA